MSPQIPAPLQFGACVVSTPEAHVVGSVAHTVSVGAPGVRQPLPAVLQAAAKVRRVGTLVSVAQMGPPAVQGAVAVVEPQPFGSAQVAARVVSCALAHVGPGAVQVVAVGVAAPQAVPLAHAGVNLVNTGAPATVVQVSGESEQLDVDVETPHPPGSAQVGVRVVSVALLHVGPGAVQVVAVAAAAPHAVALAQAGA